MRNTFRRITSLIERKERFLVVEISNEFVSATAFRAVLGKRKISAVRMLRLAVQAWKSDEALPAVQKLLSRFRKLKSHQIIVSLDPSRATTVHATVTLVRDKKSEPIDEPDLDNRIAQGIWKLFDRERGQAAKKMGTSDVGTLLTDVRVKGITLDGHRVVNPIGFTAKTVDIQFFQTFTPQLFLVELRRIVPASQLAMISEGGVAMADILARAGRMENFLFGELFLGRSHLFAVDGGAISCIGTIPWGGGSFTKVVADFFSVSEEVANKILRLHRERLVSSRMYSRIENLLYSEFQIFVSEFKRLAAESGSRLVYLHPYFHIPESVAQRGFRTGFRRRMAVQFVKRELYSEELGFALTCAKAISPETLYSPLSALLEFYFLSRDDKINKIARRHARWLIQ